MDLHCGGAVVNGEANRLMESETTGMAGKANLEPLGVFFPAQCECGHLYLERYMLPQKRSDGCVAFCWCGFCRTRWDVYKYKLQKKWFKYGEYLTTEFDTETMTATIKEYN